MLVRCRPPTHARRARSRENESNAAGKSEWSALLHCNHCNGSLHGKFSNLENMYGFMKGIQHKGHLANWIMNEMVTGTRSAFSITIGRTYSRNMWQSRPQGNYLGQFELNASDRENISRQSSAQEEYMLQFNLLCEMHWREPCFIRSSELDKTLLQTWSSAWTPWSTDFHIIVYFCQPSWWILHLVLSDGFLMVLRHGLHYINY